MMFDAIRRFRRRLSAQFPERQLYIRTEGEVRALVLSPDRQMMIAALLGGLTLWLCASTLVVITSLISPGPAVRQVGEIRARYERLLSERDASLNNATARLNAAGGSADGLAQITERRHQALAQLVSQLRLPSTLAPAPPQALVRPTATASINAVRADQDRLLTEAETYAKSRAERLKLAYHLAGLNPQAFLPASGQAQHGPMGETGDPRALSAVLNVDPAFALRIQRAVADLDQADALRKSATSLPLAPPTSGTSQASGFGVRVDPFTGRPARHTGLDFAGPVMTAIQSTAPGVVSFTGVRSGYGRTVEIDHGHGLKTRYAHLAAISVAVGDHVALGQRIGALGSSGRSTGPHLHYEVWVNGRAVNPQRFLEAGDDVRQTE